MTTHRFLQLYNLIDTALAESRVCLRCAANAASINNQSARAHFIERATRLAQVALKAQRLVAP